MFGGACSNTLPKMKQKNTKLNLNPGPTLDPKPHKAQTATTVRTVMRAELLHSRVLRSIGCPCLPGMARLWGGLVGFGFGPGAYRV